MRTFLRPAPILASILLLAACTGGAPATPSGSPEGPPASPSVSPSETPPDFGAIEHPTGATDIVLRYDQGGGFVPPSFTASSTPIFTLYGDGTVVYRNPALGWPAAQGSVMPQNPLRTTKLTEEQIQELLVYAIGEGGLGVARGQYDYAGVADASTGTFTLDAGGLKKAVNVYALGMEAMPDLPDQAARAAFGRLADRLGDFDQGGTIATEVYEPAAYRGVLMDGQGMVVPDVLDWPWDDIKPTDFEGPNDPSAFFLATRTLTPAEVAVLGINAPEGGFQGMIINGPGDGKVYSFALRPLLPDETE